MNANLKIQKCETTSKTFFQVLVGCFSYKSPIGFTVFTIIAFGLGFAISSNSVQKNIRIPKGKLEVVPQGRYRFTYASMRNTDHVKTVLASLGYKHDVVDWDLYWANANAYVKETFVDMVYLKPHQKVNRFLGVLFVTSKLSLSMTTAPYILKSFNIPEMVNDLVEYSKSKPNAKFLQKFKTHRGVMMTNVTELDLGSNKSFVQEYMEDPLLVSGHKIDIGVFVIITSVNPLRVYIYDGDVPVRFCAQKYHPFNSKLVDKYVIGVDNYLPVWKILSLSVYFNSLSYGSRDSFNYYLRSKGKDPNKIWKKIEKIIADIFITKEMKINQLRNSTVNLDHKYFQLMRFDFIVNDHFNVFMIEANASPNLSSKSKPQNGLLFDQVLYNLFSLVGIAQRVKQQSSEKRSFANHMLSADRNIFINEDFCQDNNCKRRCNASECVLCRACLDTDLTRFLHEAYREHINRIECKRVFPPAMTGEDLEKQYLDQFAPRNQIMLLWYNAKCKQDRSWCL